MCIRDSAVGVAPSGDLAHEEHPPLPPGLRRHPDDLEDVAVEVADNGCGQVPFLEARALVEEVGADL
eukprot:10929993-Alexandrium_andersonii.AAC.1